LHFLIKAIAGEVYISNGNIDFKGNATIGYSL
jgi:hypothetical protein